MSLHSPGVVLALSDADWSDPAVAFGVGVAYGMALEREAADPIHDEQHRGAVHMARREIERADARREADGVMR